MAENSTARVSKKVKAKSVALHPPVSSLTILANLLVQGTRATAFGLNALYGGRKS